MLDDCPKPGWGLFTPLELRIAARVARASGGVVMSGAASAWELRADIAEGRVVSPVG